MMDRTFTDKGHPANGGKCGACGHSAFVIGLGKTACGDPSYRFVCDRCGHPEQQYPKLRDARAYEAVFGPLVQVVTGTEKAIASGKVDAPPPCAVCGSTEKIEKHHWAPQHLFGDESENWPTAYLCQPCHVRWHQIVTPNMGARP